MPSHREPLFPILNLDFASMPAFNHTASMQGSTVPRPSGSSRAGWFRNRWHQ